MLVQLMDIFFFLSPIALVIVKTLVLGITNLFSNLACRMLEVRIMNFVLLMLDMLSTEMVWVVKKSGFKCIFPLHLCI